MGMKTVIYLSNGTVKGIIGERKGKRIRVLAWIKEEAPKLSVVNGQVTDEESFSRFLQELWEKYKLPRRVILVVNSSRTMTHFFEAPSMSGRKMMEYLPRECPGAGRMKDPVYGCRRLGKGMEPLKDKWCASVAEREFLAGHIHRFSKLGIRVLSAGTALDAQMTWLSSLETLNDQSGVIQIFDGTALLSVLWVRGALVHFNRIRLEKKTDEPEVGKACAREVSALLQSAKAEGIEEDLSRVYLAGCGEKELEGCQRMVRELDPKIRVESFLNCVDGRERFFGGNTEAGSFAAAAGGLLFRAGPMDMFRQYKKDPEREAKKKELARLFGPAAAGGIALSLVLAVQAFCWFYQAGRMKSGLDYLSDPQVLAGAARFDRLQEESRILAKQAKATEIFLGHVRTYPVFDSRIDLAVQRCAEGLVTARITGFQADSGVIQISSSAADEGAVHQFIDRLAAERDVFSGIHYTGFEYAESEKAWKLYVECYLKAPKEEAKR